MTRVFFDMDGVLAEYKYENDEAFLRKGWFLDLAPQNEAVKAIEALAEDPCFEVYTLSAIIPGSKYAVEDKDRWLRENLSGSCLKNIKSHYVLCGTSKADSVPGGIRSTDILVDDYNGNLREWDGKGVAIKYLNGINHKHGSWTGRKAGGSAGSLTEAIYEAARA